MRKDAMVFGDSTVCSPTQQDLKIAECATYNSSSMDKFAHIDDCEEGRR